MRYTITERNGCRLVTGEVPASSFGMLSHGMPKNAVIDPHAARLLGVTFAIGAPENLKALISDPAVATAARQRVNGEFESLSAAAKEWLATGFHGISSMTIFKRLTGVKPPSLSHEHHPSDPDDLGRCRRLLDQVPDLHARLNEMADVSPVWQKLVAEWEALCRLMDSEAPDWRNGKGAAPKTYARMKELGC